jgi:hypothetical protein
VVRFIGVLTLSLALVACRKSETTTAPTSTSDAIAGNGRTLHVTGTATSVRADRAVGEPIAPPFTLTVAVRGVGGASFTGIAVNGKPSEIRWQAGQPLPLRGPGPGLNLNEAALRAGPTSIVWSLDGAGREIEPGQYTLGAPVAVGAGGIATPMDSVTFTAASADALLSTDGNAEVTVSPRPFHVEGNEGALELSGHLDLDTRTVDHLTLTGGTYKLAFTPAAGGYNVDGVLEGNVAA